MIPVSARAAALRILAARAEHSRADVNTTFALTDFQRDGAQRAAAILRQHGGVIIADSVGLGKTFLAAALLEEAAAIAVVAAVVPAGLRPLWRRALAPVRERYPDRVRVVTHGQLSRGFTTSAQPHLVVVDEAHAFRNPRTRRYRALRDLTRDARVVLLTATPVNNSSADLYAQLAIFAADNAFRAIGIPSLAGLFDGPTDARSFSALRNAVILRRKRSDLRARYREIVLPNGEHLRFPRSVTLATMRHAPLLPASEMGAVLEQISFAAYRTPSTRLLLALSLLKRLQSGRHCALVSIDRLIDFHNRFVAALHTGRFLEPRVRSTSNEEQLWLPELVLPEIPGDIDVGATLRSVENDVGVLSEFRAALRGAVDAKVPALIQLLASRPPSHKTAVFTEFRDTAVYLWRSIQSRFRAALITGSGAYLGAERSTRIEVVRHFAPSANHSREPPPALRVDILVATDVMAEGMNLQDADAVVSYDLPWNPVRLIQRAGRIDRLGSTHEVVHVFNFLPDRDLEEMLGLVRRLRSKLHHLRTAVGQEAPVLEADELSDSFIAALETGDARALEDEHRNLQQIQADLSGAGPVGCIAATSSDSRRVFACFSDGFRVRELIWDGEPCIADTETASRLLHQALDRNEVIHAALLSSAIASCHAYLVTESRVPGSARQFAMLANLIRRAIMTLGILVPPDLTAIADTVLHRLPGCRDPARAAALVRAAQTPDQLHNVLEQLLRECRPGTAATAANWHLIAAIAAD